MAYTDSLLAEEGWRDKVYLDTEGHPTAGMGHKLTADQNLQYSVGDTIPNPMLKAWQNQDQTKARNAAIKQAREMKISDPKIIDALTSVNFQLGTNWQSKFPNAVDSLMSGDLQGAADHFQWKDPSNKDLGKSKWAEQTPSRVDSLVSALKGSSPDKGNSHIDNLVKSGFGDGGLMMGPNTGLSEVERNIQNLERDRGVNANYQALTQNNKGEKQVNSGGSYMDSFLNFLDPRNYGFGRAWDAVDQAFDMDTDINTNLKKDGGVNANLSLEEQLGLPSGSLVPPPNTNPVNTAMNNLHPSHPVNYNASALVDNANSLKVKPDPKLNAFNPETGQLRKYWNFNPETGQPQVMDVSWNQPLVDLEGNLIEGFGTEELRKQALWEKKYGGIDYNQPGSMNNPETPRFNPETGMQQYKTEGLLGRLQRFLPGGKSGYTDIGKQFNPETGEKVDYSQPSGGVTGGPFSPLVQQALNEVKYRNAPNPLLPERTASPTWQPLQYSSNPHIFDSGYK